ncbi:MAG: sulfate reduction electron transfer complex DsrMKJOP subunit DsrM [Deltaproteobacteria bacterium]|nr:sulfate reduction electron transfer complex DsrMKJOP subunit DsrM [Deltaproteobacteria bacterium]
MNVKYMFPLAAVVVLMLLSYVGAEAGGLSALFGIVIPYLAVIIFIAGFARRILDWSNSSVPFRIPTTCGQQKSLPWIKQNKIDNPSSLGGVILRMFFEVCCFRSLFRNTKNELYNGSHLTYSWEIWLWVAALAFHYAFLVVVVRHLRFFLEPVPACVKLIEFFDGFFHIEFVDSIIQIGLPGIMISGIVLLAAVIFLFLRRILIPQVNYISLAADYFPLFLIMGIACSGIFMRYFTKVDVIGIKEFTMGLVTFHPVIPEGIGGVFYIHLFLVSVLLAYFPFSKLMHAGGIFLSPTRNLANNTRAVRHINPWNYDVPVHTYEEYEDDFREKMIEAGLPVEKELK